MEVQCPSTGILSLASLLETGGEHRVRVVLAAEYPSFRADLERQLAMSDVLGISATSYNWYVARELIAAAREIKPRLTIVLGGIHPSHLPEYCLASTQADVVVRGEAEITFPSLLDTLARGGDLGRIHGLTFRTEDGRIVSTPDRPALSVEEMEKLPLPAYHLIPPGVYGYIPVEGSRGCAALLASGVRTTATATNAGQIECKVSSRRWFRAKERCIFYCATESVGAASRLKAAAKRARV